MIDDGIDWLSRREASEGEDIASGGIVAGTACSLCPPLLVFLGLNTTSCAKSGVARFLEIVGCEGEGMVVDRGKEQCIDQMRKYIHHVI